MKPRLPVNGRTLTQEVETSSPDLWRIRSDIQTLQSHLLILTERLEAMERWKLDK